MLASIHPLGERARGQRFGLTLGAYAAGSLAGAGVFGLVLGALGRIAVGTPVPTWAILVTAIAAVLAAFVDGSARPVPSWHRQVNEDWLADYRGWVYGAGFGLQLGVGVLTIVTSAAVYLTWLAAFLAADPWVGAAIGAGFGAARALPVLASVRIRTPAMLGARVQTLDVLDGRFRAMTVSIELLAAIALVGVAAVA